MYEAETGEIKKARGRARGQAMMRELYGPKKTEESDDSNQKKEGGSGGIGLVIGMILGSMFMCFS